MIVAGDGVELHAEVHGVGVPLVLSCALCTTSENWRAQVEPFVAAGIRVALWDYRGHGRSQAPDDPDAYTMERVVDDLARVSELASADDPVVLGGLSFGGLASLHLALARPERVRALVLVDSGPGFKNPKAQAGWEAQVERTAAFVERKGFEALLERSSATMVGPRAERPAAREAARAIAAQDPRGVAHFARRVAGPASPVIDRLGEIEVPALVIVGEKDEAYLRASEVMASRLPNARRVVIPGAGHIVNIEAAEAFEAEVIRFLRELPETTPAPDTGRR